jgi:spore coat protein U-like protein
MTVFMNAYDNSLIAGTRATRASITMRFAARARINSGAISARGEANAPRRASIASRCVLAIGLGAAAAGAFGAPVHAATATANMSVTLTITAECTVVSATTMTFGPKGLLTSNTDATATITVLCTNTTPYNIGLDKGLNGGSVSTRQMKGALASPESVNYSLYRDSGRTQNWGQTIGSDTVSGTGTGSNVPTTVYGRVPPQTSVKPDTYNDTVAITVTY